MKEADFPLEEPWPDDEAQSVVSAVRSAVAASRRRQGNDNRGHKDTSAATGSLQEPENIENALGEGGRQWALAHRSASLMRTRLAALEASMDAEMASGTEAERSAHFRAWRAVSDAATLTSLIRLEQAAMVDPLTGVGNRRALDLMLTRAMSGAHRTGSGLVVVAIDLDGLKRINDSEGHTEGDRTLTSLVDAVGSGLRASDAVFRTGGDEFAVVLPGMGLGHVGALMQRISANNAPRFTWGAAELTAECQRAADLLAAADTDLYRHRSLGRDIAGTGAVVMDLGRANRSLRLRFSRRVTVAVAAALVAISGTLTTVSSLSPGTPAALPSKQGDQPLAPAGGPGVLAIPPTITPGTTPTTRPSASASSPMAPAAAVAGSGANSPDPVAAGSSAPAIQLAPSVTTATAPSPTAAPPGTPTITPQPTASTPPTTVPVAAPTSTRGNPGGSLPAQAVAAQAAAAQAAVTRDAEHSIDKPPG